jgi:flavin-dependent dehydrogenase
MNTSSKNEAADLLIVGAGVAGSAVALACSEKLRRIVVLHAEDDRQGTESLSPDACKRLEKYSINVGVPISFVLAWWGSDRTVSSPCPGARIVQRDELAAQLRARTHEIATIMPCKSLITLTREGEMWLVSYRDREGSSRMIKTSNVCDASGRRSAVGRLLGSKRIRFDNLSCAAASIAHFNKVGTWTEAVSNGWWNLCSDGRCATLAFYSSPENLRNAGRDLNEALAETKEMRRLVTLNGQAGARVHLCGSSLLVPCAGPSWFAVGDAAMTLQPLASAGVTKALRDSELAARAFDTDGREYSRRYEMEFGDYSARLLQHYNLETRWPTSDFWKVFRQPTVAGHVSRQGES